MEFRSQDFKKRVILNPYQLNGMRSFADIDSGSVLEIAADLAVNCHTHVDIIGGDFDN